MNAAHELRFTGFVTVAVCKCERWSFTTPGDSTPEVRRRAAVAFEHHLQAVKLGARIVRASRFGRRKAASK
jgi:hypothetical protein